METRIMNIERVTNLFGENEWHILLNDAIKHLYSNEIGCETVNNNVVAIMLLEDYPSEQIAVDALNKLERTGDTLYDSNDFGVCDDCDDIVPIDELREVGNGNNVCERCLDDNYMYCERCEQYEDADWFSEVHVGRHREWWCEQCTNNYAKRCEDCGEYFDRDDCTDYDGDWYCEYCFDERFGVCDECGAYYQRDELQSDSFGHMYCESCSPKRYIRDYYYKVKSCTHTTNEDEPNINKFIGCEIETEYGDIDRRSQIVWDWGNGEEILYQKVDGSLKNDGIEIVTQILSKRYFDQFDWERLFNQLIDEGARAHDTENCGLHIHLSRTWFGKTTGEQQITAGIVVALTDEFQVYLEKFARRKDDDYYTYPEGCDDNIYLEDMTNTETYEQYAEIARFLGSLETSRYRAFNRETDKPTYEFRIFRGTLNAATYRASVELAIRLVEYAKYKIQREERFYMWSEFLTFKPMSENLEKVIARLVK